MNEMNMELIIMELVVNGGDARAKALEAIRCARKKEFEMAESYMRQCEEAIARAHDVQTDLIQKEAGGSHTEVRLFMVHAQDHLMDAMTVRDLAAEMIGICRQL